MNGRPRIWRNVFITSLSLSLMNALKGLSHRGLVMNTGELWVVCGLCVSCRFPSLHWSHSNSNTCLPSLSFCRITYCHLPFQSKWLYIGTERGNIHIVNVESFMLSGYVIMWNKAIELWVLCVCVFLPISLSHFSGSVICISCVCSCVLEVKTENRAWMPVFADTVYFVSWEHCGCDQCVKAVWRR